MPEMLLVVSFLAPEPEEYQELLASSGFRLEGVEQLASYDTWVPRVLYFSLNRDAAGGGSLFLL